MRTLYTRATDIRSVASATLTPSPTGLTAVTGPNGAGKSTLTTAIPLLAGWGQTPPGTGNLAAIIRDGAKTGTVEWAFEIGGVEYVVSRTFRRTKAGASTAKATLTIDGSDKTTTGLKPGDITAEITQITGMRPDTWLSTSLIAQSDVDALMSATPREVRDRIRDILGLRKIASAADALAAEIRSVELPDAPDTQTLDVLKSRAENTAERAEEAARDEAEASKAVEEITASVRECESRLTTYRDQAHAAAESRSRHEAALIRKSDAQQAANTAWNRYLAALESTGSGWTGPAEEGLELATEQVDSLRYRQSRVAELTPIAQTCTDDLDTLRQTAERYARDEEVAAQNANSTDSAQRLDQAREQLSRAQNLVGVLESTRAALANDGNCPTCGTNVGHAHDLTERLDSQIAATRSEAATAAEQVETIRAQQAVLQHEHDRVASAARSASAALAEAEQKSRRVLDARAELESLGDVSGLDERIKVMSQVQDAAREVCRTARALDAAGQVLEGITLVEPPPAEHVEAAQAEYTRLANDAQDHTSRYHRAAALREEITPAAQAARSEWQTAQARYDARAEAEKEVSEKNAAATLLKRFTTAYTSEKVGVITDAVNRLLPLTSGEFTDFQLDADFAPTVNYAGAVRSTGDLSGGERAVLGLLFRIGVTAAMTGGALTGTIIADEPLAALDSQSRQRVTSLLSGLPVPVVLVSHTSEAAEIAAVTANIHRARFGTTEVSMVTAP